MSCVCNRLRWTQRRIQLYTGSVPTHTNASKPRQVWALLFNLRPGDGYPFALLLAHSFLKGAARVLLETPANSLFLSRFSIESLPLIFIGTALVCTAIGLVYTRLEARWSVRALLTGTLAMLALVTFGFYAALLVSAARPLVFGMMLWKDVHWTLMNLVFWALAGVMLDVRQGKRLFGLIALGEIVAGMAGGFSVPWFVAAGGTRLLLLLSAAVTLVNVLLLAYTLRRGSLLNSHSDTQPQLLDRRPWWSLFRDRYLALFFGVSVLSFVSEYLVDYLFYEKVERAFASEQRLAAFFGIFYGVLGAGQLICGAWVSGRCLTRYGLSFGLMALPAAALFTTGAASITALLGMAPLALFTAIVAAKFFDEVGQQTIEMPAYRVLYQPLAPDQRLRVQTVRESMVEPLSIGLVGGLLWVLEHVLRAEARQILYLTVLVVVAWAALCVLLRREYAVRLTRALTARRLSVGAGLALEDPSSIRVLEQGFERANAGQVIYCLDLLEESRHTPLEAHLIRLLEHPAADVRRHVLGKIERIDLRSAFDPIMLRLPLEPDPEVRAALLQTICALSEAEGIEHVIPYLDDPEPALRRGALIGLLRHCGIDGVLAGATQLSRSLSSKLPVERAFAAQVLGEIGINSFHRPLLALLRDPDVSVQKQAIEAARQLRAKSAVLALLEALHVPALRSPASAALVEIGETALPRLEAIFVAASTARAIRHAIVQICGRLATQRSAAFLERHASHPDAATRTHVLAALVQCREKRGTRAWLQAAELMLLEAEHAARTLAAWTELSRDAELEDLSRAYLGEVDERKQRIFLLLALLYPSAVIRKVQLDLETRSGERRAHALEVLDTLIAPEWKRKIFPLLDQLSREERAKQLQLLFPQPQLGRDARILEALTSPEVGAWTRACALYCVGKSGAARWSEPTLAALEDPDPRVRETAVWARARVNAGMSRQLSQEGVSPDAHR